MVELDGPLDFRVLEGVGGRLVVGGRDPGLQGREGGLLVRGDQKLAADGSGQDHDHVGSDCAMSEHAEIGHSLPEGSLPPVFKDGVSASFQGMERSFR